MKHVCIDIEMAELSPKQRRFLPLLSHEIIQLGAVMLDENYNIESTFLALVKPSYCCISSTTTQLTGISGKMLEDAKDFVSVFSEYCNWLGAEDVSTYCWSESDYKQIWDEISVKARHRYDLLEPLKTFVDLQKTFGDILQAKNAVSFDTALQLSRCQFVGKRHTALADAFNAARILRKIATSKNFSPTFEFLYHDVERSFASLFSKDGMNGENCKLNAEYLAQFANCMPQELVKKYEIAQSYAETYAVLEEHSKVIGNIGAQTDEKGNLQKALCRFWADCKNVFAGLYKKATAKSLCTRYGIPVKQWLDFCIKIRSAQDFAFCKRKGYLRFLQLKSRLNFAPAWFDDNRAVS